MPLMHRFKFALLSAVLASTPIVAEVPDGEAGRQVAEEKIPPARDNSLFEMTPSEALPSSNSSGWGSVNGGFGLLFLTPYISTNAGYTVVTPAVPPVPGAFPSAVGSAQTVSFDYGVARAAQAWVGWSSDCGWGVRLGAFAFETEAETLFVVNRPSDIPTRIVTAPSIIPAIPGAASFGGPSVVLGGAGLGADRFSFESDLLIRTFDAQVTYEVGFDGALIVVSGGARITTLRQQYSAKLDNVAGTVSDRQQLNFYQDFAGVGPTLGLFGRQSIGDTGLAVYAGARGSILVGQLDQRAAFFQSIRDPDLVALAGSQQTRTRFDNVSDHVLTVGELEMGLEYGVDIGCSRLFLRGGFLGQTYFNAGNATSSTGTINLVGGQIAAGINY